MTRIDYFFTVLSPFTYLAGLNLEKIAAKHSAQIDYNPIDMMTLFPAMGGVPPAQRHISRREYRLQELARTARRAGLEINLQPAHWPANPIPAQAGLIAAQTASHDVGPLAHAIMRACWAEERDIALSQTLTPIFADHGVDYGTLDLAEGEARIGANTDEAITRGVFGSPFYIVGDERFWGQDRLGYLDDHLASL